METTIIPFDAADYLHDSRTQLALLRDAAASRDPRYIANAIGTVARAKGGLSNLERLTGIKRQTLNKSFGPSGNPTLETLLVVLSKLGIDLDFRESVDRSHEERREPTHA